MSVTIRIASGGFFGHRGKGCIEIAGRVHAEWHDLHAQPLRLDLCRRIAQGHAQIVGVPQHRDRADIRHRLLEERRTLR
jgi:hypothetical protein